jgi:electron transfer flavoprotein beta subunit
MQEEPLKIIVFVKQVPDSTAIIRIDNGQVNWGDAPLIINPWDEIAVEAALLQREEIDGEVIAVTMGPESAKEALKHALAMGCNQAILVSDESLRNTDSQVVAHVLAAVIKKIGDVDLAIFGKQSIDGEAGVVAAQVARKLKWPMLSMVSAVKKIDPPTTIQVERVVEVGRQVVETRLPAVMNVGKEFAEPRYPSFMGIRKASKAEIPTWNLADLGLESIPSKVQWLDLTAPPQPEVNTELITGSSPAEIANKLVEKILAEKVL